MILHMDITEPRTPAKEDGDAAARQAEADPVPDGAGGPEEFHRPTKEDLARLESFAGLGLDRVDVPAEPAEVARALDELSACAWLGFDTESRPTFLRGESSSGPHLVQFATPEKAVLFQLRHPGCREAVALLLANPAILKVGFGLDTDLNQLESKLGARPEAVLDLDEIFRRSGYGRSLGVTSAVAITFGLHFHKSRRMTTSNWSDTRLSERQLLYAANDAYAAARIYLGLGCPPPPEPEEKPARPLPGRRSRWRRRRTKSTDSRPPGKESA
jgi:hypothetical protein